MASILRKPKANIEIDAPAGPFYTGNTVTTRVNIESEERFSVRSGIIELTCTEVYYELVNSGKSTYHQKRKNILFKEEKQFLGNSNFVLGTSERQSVNFVIPDVFPPTALGKTVNIYWQLRASLDVINMRDIVEQKEIQVLPVATGIPAWSLNEHEQSKQTTKSLKEGELILSLSSILDSLAIPIKGSFEIKAKRRITFRGIRIELEKKEKAGSKSSRTIADSVVLEEKNSLEGGHYREWPFILTIPEKPTPTILTENSSVVWNIKCIIDKRLWRDFSVQSPIRVY